MQATPYADFMKLPEDKQMALIQEQAQVQNCQIPNLSEEFPEKDFVELYGTQSKKPIKLANYRYAPDGKPRGVVVGFHTMNLHAAHMINLAKAFAKQGFVFTCFDMRGHGRSQG